MTLKILNGADLGNQRIQNLGDGTAATDAVTKQQLDGAIRGLDWKQEVVAASTGNVSLTAPGATLDGVTLTNPMRILLKDQTAQAENGLYDWTGPAVPLTRTLDADSGTELSGATVSVQRGTVNADRVYRVLTDDAMTVGTTAVTFGQVGGGAAAYLGGNGLTLTGTTFDVGAGTGVTVGADTVGIDTAVVVRKYAANIGDGTATSITRAHGLGTADLTVAVKVVGTGEHVYPDITSDATNVVLTFASAPASNAYRLIVHG